MTWRSTIRHAVAAALLTALALAAGANWWDSPSALLVG